MNKGLDLIDSVMKKLKFILLFVLSINFAFSQTKITGAELNLDGFFSASTFGSSFGIGPKIGIQLNELYSVGPSFRVQRASSNNLGNTFTQTIYGGGVFAHARMKTASKATIFGGAEFEYLLSPYNFLTFQTLTTNRWAPTFFLCGGFNLKLSKYFSLNAGIYYDLINAQNSPFRMGYAFKIKNEQGQVVRILPMIYRISISIPLYKVKE